MKAFILLCVIAAASATFDFGCGENQHYEACGTACPLTCENYQNPPKACVLMCNIGCHCDEGYVKTKDGRCVKPEQCPAEGVCGTNQRYTTCGTACPLTCSNLNNPPRICPLSCKIGCVCEKGFVETDDGSCVKPEYCPAKPKSVCGINEEYYTCGTACPLTCDNYQDAPLVCNRMCKIGCACKEGFVRANHGRCVKPEECPALAPIEKSCLGEAETGLCKARIPSWHFDTRTRTCQKFSYGGCGGNGNRYTSEEECMAQCGDPIEDAKDENCALPAQPGYCMGYFERYFYNSESGECETFIYGGCGGNENNFKTWTECDNFCGD